MDWYDIRSEEQRVVRVPETFTAVNGFAEDEQIGGIIKEGECAWLVNNACMHIISLRNGQMLSTFDFADLKQFENYSISHVEEVISNERGNILLAVCLSSQLESNDECSYIALFSVEQSAVLSCVEIPMSISSVCFVEPSVCYGSLFQNFDGCLAVGGFDGCIVLIDLKIKHFLNDVKFSDGILQTLDMVQYNMSVADIRKRFQVCQERGDHFGIILERFEDPCPIQCICPISCILGLAVGLQDGRCVLYDLGELQIFQATEPDRITDASPIVKINYLEPSDDPRACVYLCVIHESKGDLIAYLHVMMYEKRCYADESLVYFENFQGNSKRLRLPLESGTAQFVSCQSIMKSARSGEDFHDSLCAISWYSQVDKQMKMTIFDLNQWYKEQMPFIINRHNATCVAGYILSADQSSMDVYIKPSSIAYFTSTHSPEEHFYPSSLSFDVTTLSSNLCVSYSWVGAQNKFINTLRTSSAAIFLEADAYFQEICRLHIVPQFLDINESNSHSRDYKYETLLSVALENNCYSLLRDCARCWADGSFIGSMADSTGISLSTLTNWIVNRQKMITNRCAEFTRSLFSNHTHALDEREQKEIGFHTRQLKLLSDLFKEVLSFSKLIPKAVYSNLDTHYKSLCIGLEYQQVVLWLLNIGLLPEPMTFRNSLPSKALLLSYSTIKSFYGKMRNSFGSINEKLVSQKTGYCRLVYIDSMIQHKYKGSDVREFWSRNGGDGLYPPNSMEALLSILLIREMDFESKCEILLYFFLDLHMASQDDESAKQLVTNCLKFPGAFKMSASRVKAVQTFWNLDHGHFLAAVDEFISPLNRNQVYPEWSVELFVEALLLQDVPNLALRVLEAHHTSISPPLKLKTYLANNLVSEAFHFARSQHNELLLELFFNCCLYSGNYGVIRDLALSEEEGQLLQSILRENKMFGAENLHFVYLLQRSKYIEAVSHMDELSKNKWSQSNMYKSVNSETPNLVLSAFNTTMAPVTQGLTDVYFRIKNKIKKKETDNKSPVPLSCQLIKQNANNLLGGIYHSSALSAHFATYYWGKMESNKESNSLLNSNNAPFLRKPQTGVYYCDRSEKNKLFYPQIYQSADKRRLSECDEDNVSDPSLQTPLENPTKKRRLLSQSVIDNLISMSQSKQSCLRTNIDNNKPTQQINPLRAKGFDIEVDQSSRQCNFDAEKSNSKQPSAAHTELQGILRHTNSSETPGNRLSVRREFGNEEEKSLRFNLPDDHVAMDTSVTEVENNKEAEYRDEPEKHKDMECGFVLRHKQVARTLSVDSDSTNDSCNGNSEENFYSPSPSLNSSAVVNELNASKPIGGPQPRKALASYSTGTKELELESQWKPPISERVEIVKSNVTVSPVKQHDPDEVVIASETKDLGRTAHTEVTNETVVATALTCESTAQLFDSGIRSIITSKSSAFTPTVSSSRVCKTQSIFSSIPSFDAKCRDFSTVVGSVSYNEPSVDFLKPSSTVLGFLQESPSTVEIAKNKMLDTTVDMTEYEQESKDPVAHADKPDVQSVQENQDVSMEERQEIIDLSTSSSSISIRSPVSSRQQELSQSEGNSSTESEGSVGAEEEEENYDHESEVESIAENSLNSSSVENDEQEQDDESESLDESNQCDIIDLDDSHDESDVLVVSDSAPRQVHSQQKEDSVSDEENDDFDQGDRTEEQETDVNYFYEEDFQTEIYTDMECTNRTIAATMESTEVEGGEVGEQQVGPASTNEIFVVVELEDAKENTIATGSGNVPVDPSAETDQNESGTAAPQPPDNPDNGADGDAVYQTVPSDVSERYDEGKGSAMKSTVEDQEIEPAVEPGQSIIESTTARMDISEDLPDNLLQDKQPAVAELNESLYTSATNQSLIDEELQPDHTSHLQEGEPGITTEVPDQEKEKDAGTADSSLEENGTLQKRLEAKAADDTEMVAEEKEDTTLEMEQDEIAEGSKEKIVDIEKSREETREQNAPVEAALTPSNETYEKDQTLSNDQPHPVDSKEASEEVGTVEESSAQTTTSDQLIQPSTENEDAIVLRVEDDEAEAQGGEDIASSGPDVDTIAKHSKRNDAESIDAQEPPEQLADSVSDKVDTAQSFSMSAQTEESSDIGHGEVKDPNHSQALNTSPDTYSSSDAYQANRKRGGSVPPQFRDSSNQQSPRVLALRRATRASSVQPETKVAEAGIYKYKTRLAERSDADAVTPPSTPRLTPIAKRRLTRDSVISDDPSRPAVELDSPASRTRSRLRRSSVDTESNASEERPTISKGARRLSMSSNVSEYTTTPTKKRRPSITSITSMTSLPDADNERMQRGASVDSKTSVKSDQSPTKDQKIAPQKEDPNTQVSIDLYSGSRRLTRHQLAVMERSNNYMDTLSVETTQTTTKRTVPSRRNSRSGRESDDGESVVSGISTRSATRRVTRSTTKEKEDIDDDVISVGSVASSRGSKRPAHILKPILESDGDDGVETRSSRRKNVKK